MNFFGSMRVSSGLGYWEWGDCGNPSIYDRFTEYGASSALLSYTCASASLASALTSGNIFFDGINANAANGGSHVPLYAPGTWAQGSSYSHLGESYNSTANALMTYSIGYNEANHNPGPVGLCLLKDVGWTINGTCGSLSSNKNYLPVILKPASTTIGPTPGFWETSTGAHEFFVLTGGTAVKNHAVYIKIRGGPCDQRSYKITCTTAETIANNLYSFTGVFYANGKFLSSTTASVSDGLLNFPLTDSGLNCGNISGVPWIRDYAWLNSSQPTMQASFVGPVSAESLEDISGYEVVGLK